MLYLESTYILCAIFLFNNTVDKIYLIARSIMEHVPIRPRYQEFEGINAPLVSGVAASGGAVTQNAQPTAAQNVQPGQVQPAAASKGLFTSLYDNKIIVLIIVIVIIIIALLAYVIYRKDDTEVAKPKPRRNQNPPVDNIANNNVGGNNVNNNVGGGNAGNNNTGGNNNASNNNVNNNAGGNNASNNNSGNNAGGNGGNNNAGNNNNAGTAAPQDLQKLLARGRAAVAETVDTVEEEPEFDDEKAEQEILDLMNDDTHTETTTGTTTETTTDSQVDTPLTTPTSDTNIHTTTSETQSFTPESVAATVQVPPITFDPARCATMVGNHQCKNKPIVNKKCRIHSK
jgi:hypothetical protein